MGDNNFYNIGKKAANRAVEEAMKAIMSGSDQQIIIQSEDHLESSKSKSHEEEVYKLTHDENGRPLNKAELDQLFNPKFNDEVLIESEFKQKKANLETSSTDLIKPINLDKNLTIDTIQAQYNTKIDDHEAIEKIVSFHPTDQPQTKFTQYMDSQTIQKIYALNHQRPPLETAYEVSAQTLNPIHPKNGSLQIQGDVIGHNGYVMVQPETIRPVNTVDKHTSDQRVYAWQMYEAMELDQQFPNHKQFTDAEKQNNFHPIKEDPEMIMSKAEFTIDKIKVGPRSKGNPETFDKLVEMHQITDTDHKISQYMSQDMINKVYRANNQIPPSRSSYQISSATNLPIEPKNLHFKGDVVDMGIIPMIDPQSIQPLNDLKSTKPSKQVKQQNYHDQGLDR